MAEDRPDTRDDSRPWTRIDEYLVALARTRSARRSRAVPPRTTPEEPRFSLSTLPFFLLMGALVVVGGGVMVAAIPGSAPRPVPRVEPREQGVAPRGWMAAAEREFHAEATPPK